MRQSLLAAALSVALLAALGACSSKKDKDIDPPAKLADPRSKVLSKVHSTVGLL